MFFDFNLKSSLLLIFFVHGVVFTLFLLHKYFRTKNKAAGWLAAFIFLCCLYIFPFMTGYAGWYSGGVYRDTLFYFPFQQLLLIPPVLYFYFNSLLDAGFKMSSKDYLHFIPAVLYLIYSLVIFVMDKWLYGDDYFYSDGRDKDFSPWYQLAGFLSFAGYLLASLQVFRRYKKISYDTLSYASSVQFRWARNFLIGLLLLWLIRAVFFVSNPEWDEFGRKFWYYLSFSLLFYWFSIMGLMNSLRSHVSLHGLSDDPLPDVKMPDSSAIPAPEASLAGTEKPPESIKEGGKPAKDEPADLLELKAKLEAGMQLMRLYENPSLTITDLSRELQLSPRQISGFINKVYQTNFNDYVNQYRIRAVLEKLEQGEHLRHTLLSIAFDCGFNSKSTFHRAFVKSTGQSPRNYLKHKEGK